MVYHCIALVYFILLCENLIMEKKAEKNTMLSVTPICERDEGVVRLESVVQVWCDTEQAAGAGWSMVVLARQYCEIVLCHIRTFL